MSAQLMLFACTAASAALTQAAQPAAVVAAGWFGFSLSLPGIGQVALAGAAALVCAAPDAGALDAAAADGAAAAFVVAAALPWSFWRWLPSRGWSP